MIYHCEPGPREHVWCQSTRPYANGTFTHLRLIVPEELDSVTVEQMKKFFKICRDYGESILRGRHWERGRRMSEVSQAGVQPIFLILSVPSVTPPPVFCLPCFVHVCVHVSLPCTLVFAFSTFVMTGF